MVTALVTRAPTAAVLRDILPASALRFVSDPKCFDPQKTTPKTVHPPTFILSGGAGKARWSRGWQPILRMRDGARHSRPSQEGKWGCVRSSPVALSARWLSGVAVCELRQNPPSLMFSSGVAACGRPSGHTRGGRTPYQSLPFEDSCGEDPEPATPDHSPDHDPEEHGQEEDQEGQGYIDLDIIFAPFLLTRFRFRSAGGILDSGLM